MSASVGMIGLLAFGRISLGGGLPATWVTWWVGDFLGGLVFAPMLVFLKTAPRGGILRVPAPELPYLAGLLAVIGVFSTMSDLPEAQPFALAFLAYSALLWCALRLSLRHLFVAVAALSCGMIFAAYVGYRPFNLLHDVVQRLLLLQFFLGCGTATAIILSAMVSEKLHRDAALLHSEKMAALGKMASGIAHEVLNPLSVIAGKTALLREALKRGELKTESLAPALDKIESTAWRISKITKSLQAFARNAESDPFQSVPVSKIIADTLDFCGQRFKQRDVELSVDPVADEIFLRCQPVQLSHVLLNLLNNAFDAVESAQGERWIRVSTRNLGGTLELAVTDSGPGVPAKNVHHVFEPFFTTKEVGEGTGLGLSVSSGIVKQHGGTLTLDTSSLKTRFVVQLPIG